MICEKCWSDAGMRSYTDGSKNKLEHYRNILKEREGNPCNREEQRGIKDENEVFCDLEHCKQNYCGVCIAKDVRECS